MNKMLDGRRKANIFVFCNFTLFYIDFIFYIVLLYYTTKSRKESSESDLVVDASARGVPYI
jgi:hypothetical protein